MEPTILKNESASMARFINMIRNPVKFRVFLLKNLPAAYFSGVRLREVNSRVAIVSIRYKWFTKNPFRSTYFACLSMAAEMSTGVLAMAHLYDRTPRVSMLVTAIEGSFVKKATDTTRFICEDGELIKDTIEQAVQERNPKSVRCKSVGRNKEGEVVAEFFVTWSFKARKQD